MTPFQIRWKFTKLPPPSVKLTAQTLDRIQRMYFEDAGRRWGYVLRGWPLDGDNRTLQLPGGQPFTYLEIEVRFERFPAKSADAVGRVPAESIKRLSGPAQKTFPYSATIYIDLGDLDQLLDDRAMFFDTIVHEIGHALGIGTSWSGNAGPKLVHSVNKRAFYTGTSGCREYAQIKGHPYGTPIEVPLDEEVTGTTPAYHWDEKALRFDIMSTELDAPVVGNARSPGGNVISRVSVGALQDLGYVVNMAAAQALPPG